MSPTDDPVSGIATDWSYPHLVSDFDGLLLLVGKFGEAAAKGIDDAEIHDYEDDGFLGKVVFR